MYTYAEAQRKIQTSPSLCLHVTGSETSTVCIAQPQDTLKHALLKSTYQNVVHTQRCPLAMLSQRERV